MMMSSPLLLLSLLAFVKIVESACGDDWCSCGYGEYVTGTDCSGGSCWCYCSDGIRMVIDDYGECSGLGGGAIFGIVFGAFLLLIGGGGFGFWWYKKKKQRQKEETTLQN
mmetsp:Transcript_15994/g.30221  ORF Transcript_15994/g.30221 Transcript_15994/m.30221 type:complete len:110 (-) Transcript_15994:146-475(-)